MDETQDFWKKCNICKKQIFFRTKYYVCNVSTCNRKRTGLIFCSVSCWDAHLPIVRHRESWAEERRAPSVEEWKKILAGEMEEPQPKREEPKPDPAAAETEPAPKLKSPANTSAPKVILRRTGR